MVETDIATIDSIVETTGRDKTALIPVLQQIQSHYNYLPSDALKRLCAKMDVTAADVTGVSTFYSQFRLKPAGRHFVKICIGTACHVKGADLVHDSFKRYLGIPDGEDTDNEKIFTVEKVACLGCCMLAPAVQIDDITYGFVEPGKVASVLKDFLESRKKQADSKHKKAKAETIAGEARICLCSSCVAGGSKDVHDELSKQVSDCSLNAEVKIVGCTGVSYQTPMVEISLKSGASFHYGMVKPENVRAILLHHFIPHGITRKAAVRFSSIMGNILSDDSWEPVTRYCIDTRAGADSAYLGRQKHLAMEHCGKCDPGNIDEYLGYDGFKAMRAALETLSPEDIFDRIKKSGLRGRGGAGYPTSDKWQHVKSADAETKYIICNGDEGDPGAFMDRMILESFPFRVVEGMIIAARVVGAAVGRIYIRSEYPLALERVKHAVELCRERGLLGERILNTDFSFDLEIVSGAGAFVCGEETALIAAIEGKRGMPRMRPPFPAESGLHGKPTLVNNVETFALVPWIIRDTDNQFATLGTERSKGTKTFALAGKIQRGGLIEVPMGITLREIVEDIGGGVEKGRHLKAIQVGGPSGGCIPADRIDTPVDYNELLRVGAMMGSGGMVVLDDTDCMVDIARYFLAFTQEESCGKCTYCRIGTKRMLEILERLCEGRGRDGDIDELEHLAGIIKEGSLCGLGRTAPNPVLSTILHFRSEYEAHIQGKCPAHKCRALIEYRINDNCIGCTKCAQKCPVEAIDFRPYHQHEIDQEKCTRCDTCRQVCPTHAVEITS